MHLYNCTHFSFEEKQIDDLPANPDHLVELLKKQELAAAERIGRKDESDKIDTIEDGPNKPVRKGDDSESDDEAKNVEEHLEDDTKTEGPMKPGEGDLAELSEPWPPALNLSEEPHLYRLPGEDVNVSIPRPILDMVRNLE